MASREWITPKTDWEYPDALNYWDYNRIRNNLLFLHDLANIYFPPEEPLDLGGEKTVEDNYYASELNAFEQALERINKRGYSYDLGETKTFVPLGKFIDDDEKNRLEKGCLRLYQMFEEIAMSRRTAFRANGTDFVEDNE